jgi:toxin ParE1/3/4
MHKIIIQPLAIIDLEEIWFYTFNKWSYRQANKYSLELDLGIEEIAYDPKIGKQIDHIKNGYFKYKVNNHYIFYKRTQSEIQIIRILHEKMDTPRHLH